MWLGEKKVDLGPQYKLPKTDDIKEFVRQKIRGAEIQQENKDQIATFNTTTR